MSESKPRFLEFEEFLGIPEVKELKAGTDYSACLRKKGYNFISTRNNTDDYALGTHLSGLGSSQEEALEQLWKKIIEPSNFTTFWISGDNHVDYRWDAKSDTLLELVKL